MFQTTNQGFPNKGISKQNQLNNHCLKGLGSPQDLWLVNGVYPL